MPCAHHPNGPCDCWPPKRAPKPDGTPTGYGWPPAHWPSLGQLTYTKELITVVLLVVALPWLIARLTRNPASVLSGVRATRV